MDFIFRRKILNLILVPRIQKKKMKRQRPYAWDVAKSAQAKKKRRVGDAPKRAYTGSRVPIASRGYRMNRTEKKVADIDSATYQANTTGSITLLANPSLGTDMTNRVGRRIVLKSVYIRGFVASQPAVGPTAANAAAQQVRMIIFADLQPNGAAPAIGAVLKEALPNSQLNLDNRDRFKVYCDKVYNLDPYGFLTTAGSQYASMSNQIKQVKKYKKINLEVIFNSTNGGTIGDINSGALYMLWVGSTATGTADANAVVTTRVRFIDN